MVSQDPTKAAEELTKWAEGLEQRAQKYTELRQRMDQTSVTKSSSDGTARVTVDSNGVPTELTVTERARGAAPERISEALMSCMRQAQAELRRRVSELVDSTVPEGDEPGRNIVAQYESRFPDPLTEADSGGSEVPEINVAEDDDDFGGHTYLR